jgi:hypothetical protein
VIKSPFGKYGEPDFQGKKVRILAISIDEGGARDVKPFLTEHHYTMPVVLDMKAEVVCQIWLVWHPWHIHRGMTAFLRRRVLDQWISIGLSSASISWILPRRIIAAERVLIAEQ